MRREIWLILGMLLVVLALAGAIVFSMHLFHQRHQAVQQGPAASSVVGDADALSGERRYARSCAACHGADGGGRRGSFPPLAGHMPDLVAREGGREYVIDVLLYGLSGAIDVDGTTYRGFMAPVSRIEDGEVAAVLNHAVHAWDNDARLPEDFQPFDADEVAQRRGRQLGPADVHAQREILFGED